MTEEQLGSIARQKYALTYVGLARLVDSPSRSLCLPLPLEGKAGPFVSLSLSHYCQH